MIRSRSSNRCTDNTARLVAALATLLFIFLSTPMWAGWLDDQRNAQAQGNSVPAQSDKTAAQPDKSAARKWKVMVVIPEYHIRRQVPDPAAETAIVDELIKAGYRMMDIDLAAKYRYNPEVDAAIKAGDLKTIKRVFRDAKADILVIGEAFSQGTNNSVGNMVSCRARVEVKAIRRDSGVIVASVGEQGGGLDFTEELAGKTALDNTARVVATKLIKDFSEGADVGSDSIPVELIISGVKSLTMLGKIEKEIKGMNGLKSLSRDEFDEGIATLEISVDKQLFDDLQTKLEKLKACRLDVIKSTKNSMTIMVSG